MPPAFSALTVVHIEDDPIWTDVVRRAVGEVPGVVYAGHAATGTQGVTLCRAEAPDVVLLDLKLPDGDGFGFGAQIRSVPLNPQIVLLSCRADDVALFRAWSEDHAGLIGKSIRCADEVKAALVAVAAGKRYFSAEIMAAIQRFRRSPDAFPKILSARELSLIDRFVRGDSNAVIATAVGLSPHTVHSHRKSIMGKLNVHSMSELMRWGAARGFDLTGTGSGAVSERFGQP